MYTKKLFLMLGMFATLSLSAAAESQCCSAPQVEPCPPCPCECYPPAYCGIECGVGLTANIEFLYWFARETNLPFAGRVNVVSRNSTFPDAPDIALLETLAVLETSWDPGFRVGLAWDMGCDDWDLSLNWTYFFNKSSDSICASFAGLQPVLGESGLVNPWIDNNAQTSEVILPRLPLFEKISAKWSLYFNQIDLLLGKTHWLSPCFMIKFNAGLRGFWNRIRFDVNGSQGPKTVTSGASLITDFNNETSNNWKNDQWALGITMGVQPNWYFYNNFLLFANLDIAMGWGNFCQEVDESYFMAGVLNDVPFVNINQTNDYQQRFSHMATFLDLALGLRWEEYWCCNRFSTALSVAWEQHVLFNAANRLITFGSVTAGSTQTFSGFINNIGALLYGGLVVRFQFGF